MKLTSFEQKEYERYTMEYDFSEYLKDKTVLITGSKGIVGSGLIRWILYENEKRGNNTRIIASSRNPEKVPEFIENGENITFCRFGEEGQITEPVDYIIHTAAPTSNKVFKEQPVESLRSILDGAETILDLAKRQEKCSVIYLSSEEAYGTPNEAEPVRETFVGAIDSLNVRNCYPLGKKASELLCKAYYEEYGLDVKIIRPTVILGLYQPYDSVKVEAEILRCIMENKNLFMKSNGMTKKCVIYTMDALSAVFTVLFKGQAGEAYNATNPDTYETVKDRAYKAFAKFNPNVTIEFAEQDVSMASGYLPQRALQEDITKIRELGWRPLAGMDEIYEIDRDRFSKEA
ncbi:MAG: NAD(P)-dependent oxidoreductase [Lachnospiraceae bacterium]|nr:NAD(P)-dependent oxidoreductase [Lachnospiraceae bacterium]